jgi:hypothetical protein
MPAIIPTVTAILKRLGIDISLFVQDDYTNIKRILYQQESRLLNRINYNADRYYILERPATSNDQSEFVRSFLESVGGGPGLLPAGTKIQIHRDHLPTSLQYIVENRTAAIYYMMITESPEYRSKYLTYLTNIRMGNTSKTYGLATNLLATRDVINKLMNDNGDEIAAYRRVYKFTRLENPYTSNKNHVKISNVCVFQDSELISDTTDIAIDMDEHFGITKITFDSTTEIQGHLIHKDGSDPKQGNPAVWNVYTIENSNFNSRFHIMFTIEYLTPMDMVDTHEIVHIQYGLDSLYS